MIKHKQNENNSDHTFNHPSLTWLYVYSKNIIMAKMNLLITVQNNSS